MEEISGLVFSRGLSAAEWQQVSRKRQLGKYLKLAPGVYVPAGVFAEAPPWERHRLGALAVGASGTHILAGISAAALWGMWVYIVDDAPVEYYVTQGRVKPQEVGRRFRGRLPQGHRITGQRATVTSIPLYDAFLRRRACRRHFRHSRTSPLHAQPYAEAPENKECIDDVQHS